jgi:hypothetical protein
MFIFLTTNEDRNMNTPLPITNPVAVVNRLEQLGLKQELLQEVIDRMILARRSVTDNHPPGSGGWMSWSEGTARLREMFTPLGWDRNEDYRISSIHSGSIRVAVCNTDDGTGTLGGQPQNRSKKGAGTDYVVAQNQGVLGTILEEAANVIQLPGTNGGVVYWYLCVYCEGDVVRAELSCPSECGNGFFTAFRERIILIGGDDDNGGVTKRSESPDGGDVFEITVTRKEA